MAAERGTVCVTGGTGFIGSWLIMRLLNYGYSVRTTIRRNSAHKRDLSFLTSLPGATERLKIFEADLSEPESFMAAIEGCNGVFHVATPLDFEGKEAEEIVTKRSIDGAIAILKACLDSKTVKKVVYTSSAAAVVVNGKDLDVMDESYWSDVNYIKAQKMLPTSYFLSKTLTEKAVLEFSEKNGLDVVTLIPSFVVGPFICPKFPGSVKIVLETALGKSEGLVDIDMVNVDDVVRAHIFIFEHPEAKGRYNCSSDVITVDDLSKLFSVKYPEFQIPKRDTPKETKGLKFPCLSSKKLIESGFKFKYGVEETVDDAIKCCKEKGYL
ncbi:hypothetical protein UlMin_045076 [Ulmus minor]